MQVDLKQARSQLSKFVELAVKDEEVTIGTANRSLVRLVSYQSDEDQSVKNQSDLEPRKLRA